LAAISELGASGRQLGGQLAGNQNVRSKQPDININLILKFIFYVQKQI